MGLSTPPNSQALDQITKATGLGAFVIGGTSQGGGSQWGQNLNENAVTALVKGPAAAMMSGITDLASALVAVEEYLVTMSLESLQMFKGIIPGTLDDDFIDAATAAATIVNHLGTQAVLLTVEAFTKFVEIITTLMTGGDITPLLAHFADGFPGVGQLANVFTDVRELLGNPLGLGTGTPTLPDIADIPLLGGLLTGGLLDPALLGDLPAQVRQIFEIIQGLIVTPVDAAVQAFKDWFGGIATKTSQLDPVTGKLPVASLLGTIGLANLPNTLLTTTSSLLAGNITGTVSLANLPGSLLTTASSIASTAITGTLNLAQLPSSILTTASTIAASQAPWAAPIDALAQAWGGAGGATPAQLQQLAASINPTYVTGALGGANIAQTVQNIVDGWSKAVQNNNALANTSIAQAQSYLNSAMQFLGWNPGGATPPSSVAAIASNVDQSLQQRAVQKDAYANIDPTIDASFPFSDAYTQSTLPTIAVTAANPVSAPITCRDGGVKQSIRFKGYVSSGSLIGFYANLYWVNPTTGAWTKFYTTTNYSGLLATGSTPQWNSINLAAADYINPNQGDVIQVEIVVVGGGTYTMVGKSLSPQLLPLPGVYPSMPAAIRQQVPVKPTLATTNSTSVTNTPNPTLNMSVTLPAGGCAIIVPVNVIQSASGTTNVSVSIGGQPLLGGNAYLGAQNGYFTYGAWYGYTTLSGPQTVTVSCNGTGNWYVSTMVAVYQNVSSVVIGAQASGNSANCSIGGISPNQNQISAVGYVARNGSAAPANGVVDGNIGQAAVVEFSSAGTGSCSCASGYWGDFEVRMTGVWQPAPASVPNPVAPGSAVSAGVAAYARAQPWIGLAGGAAPTSYSPVTRTFTGGGSGQVINPTAVFPWANYFDVIVFPDGGGGANGNQLSGGLGGHAGSPSAVTLTAAQAGASSWTMNIGTGGSWQTAGQGVSVVIPGYGTISRAGGAGETAGWGAQGGAAGDNCPGITVTDHYGNQQYYAGGSGGGVGGQQPGNAPGGAGGGGNVAWMNSNFFGGPGGPAQVIIRAYQ